MKGNPPQQRTTRPLLAVTTNNSCGGNSAERLQAGLQGGRGLSCRLRPSPVAQPRLPAECAQLPGMQGRWGQPARPESLSLQVGLTRSWHEGV